MSYIEHEVKILIACMNAFLRGRFWEQEFKLVAGLDGAGREPWQVLWLRLRWF